MSILERLERQAREHDAQMRRKQALELARQVQTRGLLERLAQQEVQRVLQAELDRRVSK